MRRSFALVTTVWISILLFMFVALPVYAATPTITSFTPVSGKIGDMITITGTNFTGATAVKFNGTTSESYSVVSDSSITAAVPSGAIAGKITVTTPDGTATSADDFTVWVPSSLDVSIDPALGYIGALSGITLYYSLTGPKIYTGSVSLDNTGNATIGSLMPGSYTLCVFGSHWLRRTITDVELSGSKSVTVSLANGDADGDNMVNLVDFVVLDANFGSANAMADIDGSGQVNLFDYVIIDQNFGAIGDGVGKTKINPIDGAEMVWVPAGEFLMGSASGYSDETPQRSVYLDGYWIYKYEVTVAQYRAFCLDTGRSFPTAPSWGWNDIHPMVFIRWQDAVDYAKWAGASLTTEAQWEKAARGTDGRMYPWGNNWDALKCVNNNTSPTSTMPVGSYLSGVSPYGCMDMAGNVWEWCSDWYDATYYQTGPNRNPLGPANGTLRALRGGSWTNSLEIFFPSSNRGNNNPLLGPSNRGFRCAVVE